MQGTHAHTKMKRAKHGECVSVSLQTEIERVAHSILLSNELFGGYKIEQFS